MLNSSPAAPLLLCGLALLFSATGDAQDRAALCQTKYKAISDGFYAYNERAAVSKAVMDRIALHADMTDVQTIRRREAREWYWAIDAFIATGQSMLQKLLEYRALKCAEPQASEVEKMIGKTTDDLKASRERQGTLMNGFPPSTFKRDTPDSAPREF